ncbi:MAG TPA: thiamine phosphate synthase [Acidobacteriaceae bacterium]|nr:thiamine phosphate synthase [Acidobacteriaceae bacterium]
MLLCAITDRRLAAGSLPVASHRDGFDALVALTHTWAINGVSLIQLREKDLPIPELVSLAEAVRHAIGSVRTATRLILNAPVAVALTAGADGIHLPADIAALQPLDEIRRLYAASVSHSIGHSALWISVSCHTLEEVEHARRQQADCILFAPVFEKVTVEGKRLPGQGLATLAAACRVAHPVPVLALGGITVDNAEACIAAGASGIAAIRLFHAPASAWSVLSHRGAIDAASGAP